MKYYEIRQRTKMTQRVVTATKPSLLVAQMKSVCSIGQVVVIIITKDVTKDVVVIVAVVAAIAVVVKDPIKAAVVAIAVVTKDIVIVAVVLVVLAAVFLVFSTL